MTCYHDPCHFRTGTNKCSICGDEKPMTTTATAAQPLDLDKLEALAKAATPGPWKAKHNDVFAGGRYRVCNGVTAGGSAKGMIDERQWEIANATFIAAANPQTVLALIAQARTARTSGTLNLDTTASDKQALLDDLEHAIGGFSGGVFDRIDAIIQKHRATPDCGACPGDGSICKTECRIRAECPPCNEACEEFGVNEYCTCRAAQAHHAAETTGEDARDAALLFADDVISNAFDGGDLDGGTVQEMAEARGLIKPRTMVQPCGEVCNCMEADAEFPTTCYRKTYMSALRAAEQKKKENNNV